MAFPDFNPGGEVPMSHCCRQAPALDQDARSWEREARVYRDALIVAENALDIVTTNAGMFGPVTEQALRVVRAALAPWTDVNGRSGACVMSGHSTSRPFSAQANP